MPQLDGKGPEKKGACSGRGLGRCKNRDDSEALNKPGQGMELKRQAGGAGGKGKRIRRGKQE